MEIVWINLKAGSAFETNLKINEKRLTAERWVVGSNADPEGGGGGQGVRIPPGKSQVIWVSIGNKQLDPPGKSWTPPGKCWTPSGTLKNDRFL